MSDSHFHFAGLRLTHKVTAIGATGVLGLALVGGLYLFGTWWETNYERTAAEARAIAASTERLSIQMLQARRAEKDFLLRSVNRGASETGSASSQVLSSAQSLSNESSRLKTEVQKFLATVRAA